MFCLVCKMRLMNTTLRTIKSSIKILVQEGGNGWSSFKIPHSVTQYRRLMVSQCMKNEDPKSDSNETINLEEWKSILKLGTQSREKEEIQVHEDSSLNGMRELVEMWRLAGRAVPELVTTEQLKVLMELPTKTARKKYLKFLCIKENIKRSNKEKKKEIKSKMETLDQLKKDDTRELKNTFLLKFWDKSMDLMQRWKSAQAMKFGQPIVFDMVYEKYMSRYELENTVRQVMECEGCNRRSDDPFHLYFCNLQTNGPYHKELVKRYMGAWDNILVTTTEKSHVDIFPQDQLVYLTADSPHELKQFDHNKIYIIGSLVDKCQQTGLSLANAKRLNLATARLPLDRYLKWDVGAKNLTLDQMMRILICLKEGGDWKKALSFVPTRKHEGFIERVPTNKNFFSKHSKKYEFGQNKTLTNQHRVQSISFGNQKRCWKEEN